MKFQFLSSLMFCIQDYWINDKDLIHKIYKVFVPRYANTIGPYTNVCFFLGNDSNEMINLVLVLSFAD